jgi:hypothetical protein
MRHLLRVTAAVLIGLGLIAVFFPTTVFSGFTRLGLPAAAVDSPQWIALAFARLTAASFIASGVLLLVLRRVMPDAAVPMVAWGIATSLAIVAAVAATQAIALFATPASWGVAGLIAILALGFAAVGVRSRTA